MPEERAEEGQDAFGRRQVLERTSRRRRVERPDRQWSPVSSGDTFVTRPTVLVWTAVAFITMSAFVIVGVFVGLRVTASDAATPHAASWHSDAVGALFTLTDGKLRNHFCTASVVDSPHGDLVLTAAHCMRGRSAGTVAFVPGFADGLEPYGVWAVTRVFVDQHWQTSADPDDDFAFLVVSQAGTHADLQSMTGAEHIGIGAMPGVPVTVAGYPDDLNFLISCHNKAQPFGPTQLEFECAGYTDGTSGGPFLTDISTPDGDGTVIGVVGGYHQGGYTASVSYAARFGPRVEALYRTAVAQSTGSVP